MSPDFKKRRIFITSGTEYYQLFTFAQNKNDYSIYVSSPDFAEIKWLHALTNKNTGQLSILDSPGDGKLSLHGSGMSAIRAHDDPQGHALVVHGSYLFSGEAKRAGVRHLFTIFITKPEHIPRSAAFNRHGDYSFKIEELKPYVLVFFAVPAIRHLTVEVMASFHADDLEQVPPDSGWGVFNLALHAIVWFGYRTKYMDKWPKHPHICYHDGYAVPIFIGKADGHCQMELRNPTYQLSGDELKIIF